VQLVAKQAPSPAQRYWLYPLVILPGPCRLGDHEPRLAPSLRAMAAGRGCIGASRISRTTIRAKDIDEAHDYVSLKTQAVDGEIARLFYPTRSD
jgi:hypothetical protein